MDKWWERIPYIGIWGYVLFIISEIISLSKMKSNGVIEFISRKVGFLGGRRIRLEIGIRELTDSGGNSIQEEENDALLSDETLD